MDYLIEGHNYGSGVFPAFAKKDIGKTDRTNK